MAPAEAPTITDPSQAVSYLQEISPEMRGCAVISKKGEVLAATGEPERWGPPAAELLAAADEAGDEPVAHAHVATAEGEAFCVRENGLVAVAVTERFVLSSLTIFDLRSVLRGLSGS